MGRIPHYRSQFRSYFRGSIYFRLLPYLRPYRRILALVFSISVVLTGLGLMEPWTFKFLIDNALGDKPLPAWVQHALPTARESKGELVLLAIGAGVAIRLAQSILTIIRGYIQVRVDLSVVLDFKADLFRHLQRLSFTYHDRTTVGDSLYRLNGDTGFIGTLLWGNFERLLMAVLTLGGVLWIVIRLDWQLALLSLASAPILYASIGFYSKYLKTKSKAVKGLEADAGSVLQEVLNCLRVVKAFGQETREQRRFEHQSHIALRARFRLTAEQMFFSSSLEFVTQLNRSLILLLGGFHVLHGELTVGGLVVILAYVDQIHAPIVDIGETFSAMQLAMASAERTLEVLDIEPEIQDRPGAKALSRVEGAIAFENVSFAYTLHGGRRHEVLHDISFVARPGAVLAIVGPTGAGKTTLSNLIARFYDPAAGRVTLDGHDLRDLTVQTLRDNIALVIQEPILFSGTIRDNIAYGRPDASQEEIIAAAEAANAHDFITLLPDGYESQVGERGVRLSGGERQRIAIARAFLKDAPILILDEPTSSIDAQTESVIINALDRLMTGRTTFIIAHRLATIRRADQILVITQGRIAEHGVHAELLTRNGFYAKSYSIQTGGLRRGHGQDDPIALAEDAMQAVGQ